MSPTIKIEHRPEYVGGGEEALGYEHWVPRIPLFPLQLHQLVFLVFFLHPVVSDHPERSGGYVQGVCNEVDHVPHVVHVLLQADVPQLLHLRPNQAGYPSQDEPTDTTSFTLGDARSISLRNRLPPGNIAGSSLKSQLRET